MNKYFTIESIFTETLNVKDSKFIAYLYPVKSKEEIENILKKLWKEHNRASHICYAYQLDKHTYYYYDDGEPSGTAGQKIYLALKIKNLLQAVIFVVRYFGGTKLGMGPLSKAYFDISMKVLNNAKIIEKYFTKDFEIEITYNQFNKIRKQLLDFTPFNIIPEYSDSVRIKISVKRELAEKFEEFLNEAAIKYKRDF